MVTIALINRAGSLLLCSSIYRLYYSANILSGSCASRTQIVKNVYREEISPKISIYDVSLNFVSSKIIRIKILENLLGGGGAVIYYALSRMNICI